MSVIFLPNSEARYRYEYVEDGVLLTRIEPAPRADDYSESPSVTLPSEWSLARLMGGLGGLQSHDEKQHQAEASHAVAAEEEPDARSRVLTSLDLLSVILQRLVWRKKSAGGGVNDTACYRLTCAALVCKQWSAAVREASLAWRQAARADYASLFLISKLRPSAIDWRKAAAVLHRTHRLPCNDTAPGNKKPSYCFLVVTAALHNGTPLFEAAMPFVIADDGASIYARAENALPLQSKAGFMLNDPVVNCTHCTDPATVETDSVTERSIQLARCSVSVVRCGPDDQPVEVAHIIHALSMHGHRCEILPPIPHVEDAEGFHISFDAGRTPDGLLMEFCSPNSEGSVLHGPLNHLASCSARKLLMGDGSRTFSACGLLYPSLTLTLKEEYIESSDVPDDTYVCTAADVRLSMYVPIPGDMAEAEELCTPSSSQLTQMLDSLDFIPLKPPVPICVLPLLQAAVIPEAALAAVLELPAGAEFPLHLPELPQHDWTSDVTRGLERVVGDDGPADRVYKTAAGLSEWNDPSRYHFILSLSHGYGVSRVLSAVGVSGIYRCTDSECMNAHMNGGFGGGSAFDGFTMELQETFSAEVLARGGENDTLFSMQASLQLARMSEDGNQVEIARLLTEELRVSEVVLDDEFCRRYFSIREEEVCAEISFVVPPSAVAPYANGDPPFSVIYVNQEAPQFSGLCCPPIELELRVVCAALRVPGQRQTKLKPRYWRLSAGVEEWGPHTPTEVVDWLRRYSWQRLPSF